MADGGIQSPTGSVATSFGYSDEGPPVSPAQQPEALQSPTGSVAMSLGYPDESPPVSPAQQQPGAGFPGAIGAKRLSDETRNDEQVAEGGDKSRLAEPPAKKAKTRTQVQSHQAAAPLVTASEPQGRNVTSFDSNDLGLLSGTQPSSDGPPSEGSDSSASEENDEPKRIKFGFEADWRQTLSRCETREQSRAPVFDISACTVVQTYPNPTIIQEKPEDDIYRYRKRKWGKKMARFYGSPYGAGVEGQMQPICPIYASPTGDCVALYGNGSESVVVKERHSRDHDVKQTYTRGLPEALMQGRLSQLPMDNENIVKLLDYRIFPMQYKHRLYMEYAGGRDLRLLKGRYRRWMRHFPEPFLWCLFNHIAKALVILEHGAMPPDADHHIAEEDQRMLHKYIAPEQESTDLYEAWKSAGVLKVYQACKEAGFKPKYAERKKRLEANIKMLVSANKEPSGGASDLNDIVSMRTEIWNYRPQWKEIVHLDISINNIFLSEAPNGSFFDGYPVFKLGDFGLAFETDRLAGRDTWRDAVMRIPARRAPETDDVSRFWLETDLMHKLLNDEELTKEMDPRILQEYLNYLKRRLIDARSMQAPKRQTAKTNVFQLGRVMLEMITLETPGSKQNKVPSDPNTPDLPYSKALKRLVNRCLQENPRHRPSPLALYKTSLHALVHCRRKAEGMEPGRFAVRWRDGEIDGMETGFYLNEDWRIPPLRDIRFDQARGGVANKLHPPDEGQLMTTRSDHTEFFDRPFKDYRRNLLRDVVVSEGHDKLEESQFEDFQLGKYKSDASSSEVLDPEGEAADEEDSDSSDERFYREVLGGPEGDDGDGGDDGDDGDDGGHDEDSGGGEDSLIELDLEGEEDAEGFFDDGFGDDVFGDEDGDYEYDDQV